MKQIAAGASTRGGDRRWGAEHAFGGGVWEELLLPAGLLFLPWPSLHGLGACCWDLHLLLWAGTCMLGLSRPGTTMHPKFGDRRGKCAYSCY